MPRKKNTVYPRLGMLKDGVTEQVKTYFSNTANNLQTIPEIAEALGLREQAVAEALYRLCVFQPPSIFPTLTRWRLWRRRVMHTHCPKTPFNNKTIFYKTKVQNG